jgi:hypothetical protein
MRIVSPSFAEVRIIASPRMRPSTLQGLTNRHSSPRDAGVRPQGNASALPSTQKQTVPGSTTCCAPGSSAARIGSVK